ncbi:MAG TPA: hypothetical protein VMM78_10675 [Thermomicrobiales bacterium]|nr:hypothetical protein [Thermomicrobiales bacterium]
MIELRWKVRLQHGDLRFLFRGQFIPSTRAKQVDRVTTLLYLISDHVQDLVVCQISAFLE